MEECYVDDQAVTQCLQNRTQLTWQGSAFTGLNSTGIGGPNSASLSASLIQGNGEFKFQASKTADIFGNGKTAWLNTQFMGYANTQYPGVGNLSVCTQNDGGTIDCQMQYYLDNTGGTSTKKNVFWADMDGDGRADLVVQLLNSNSNGTGDIFVCLSNKQGTGFSTNPAAPSTCSLYTSVLGWTGDSPVLQGDFNGDGRIDFAVYQGEGPRPLGTPTIQFFPERSDALANLSPQAREVARIPGLPEPSAFLAMFRYVREKGYETEPFPDWMKRQA